VDVAEYLYPDDGGRRVDITMNIGTDFRKHQSSSTHNVNAHNFINQGIEERSVRLMVLFWRHLHSAMLDLPE
jgi:hypothetical protein